MMKNPDSGNWEPRIIPSSESETDLMPEYPRPDVGISKGRKDGYRESELNAIPILTRTHTQRSSYALRLSKKL